MNYNTNNMTPETIKESAKISEIISNIEARQSDYFSANGRYWQGIVTKGDQDKKAGSLDSWAEFGIDLSGMKGEEMAVNYYKGPRGEGYEIVIVMKEGDDSYRKVISIGAEPDRSQDWTLYRTQLD